LIRLPKCIRRPFPFTVLFRLPRRCYMSVFRFRHSPVSRFPFRASLAVYLTHTLPNDSELLGPPEFYDISLPACHGLLTPADLHIQAFTDDLVLPSAIVKTLGVRSKLISKLYQHFRVRDHPYGLQDSLSTLHLFCSPTSMLTPPQAQDSIRVGG
jgi:hypothetical protein